MCVLLDDSSRCLVLYGIMFTVLYLPPPQWLMIGVNLSGLGQSGIWGLVFHAGLIGGCGQTASGGWGLTISFVQEYLHSTICSGSNW